MIYENSTFEGVVVVLDGNEYRSCILRKCKVVFRGTTTCSLSDTSFEGCEFGFDGPAALTINYMSAMYQGLGEFGKRLIEGTFNDIRTGSFTKIASFVDCLPQ